MLLVPDQRQVDGEQAEDQGRDDQDVQHEQAAQDVVSGELAAEHQEGQPRPHERDGQGERVGDAQARAR